MEKQFYVYIMANVSNKVLYTGVTSDLKKRVYEHKEKLIEGFTKRYNVNKLVFYEVFGNAVEAISREKQIKGGSREMKFRLVESINAGWDDLYDSL